MVPSLTTYVQIDVLYLLFHSIIVLTWMQIEDYREELEEMKNMTRQEYLAHLRRYGCLLN